MDRADTKSLLLEIYQAAIAAVAPGPALTRALKHQPVDDRVWLIALGKAAAPMAEAAVDVLAGRPFQDSQGRGPAGGLIVAPAETPAPHPSVTVIVGDHPEPGAGSRAAADALDALVKTIPPGDTAWVLLSGGTTSLVGAPQPGIAADELKALYGQLLRSGLDIKEMNRVRKRFTRWSGGRLARSLAHARVRCVHRVGCHRRRSGRHRLRAARPRPVHLTRCPRRDRSRGPLGRARPHAPSASG